MDSYNFNERLRIIRDKMSLKINLSDKNKNIFIIAASALILLTSTFYIVDKVFTTKKLNKTTFQKDSLQTENSKLQDDIKNKYIPEIEQKTAMLQDRDKSLSDKEREVREMQYTISKQDSILKSLNRTLKEALLGFKADELSVEIKNGKIYVSMMDKLLFKSGKADVEPKGKTALQKLAKVLIKNTDINILVEGHTDNVPIKNSVYADNWDLSVARANVIIRFLIGAKVEPSRLIASGRGEFFPLAPNTSEKGKARNRRTEIILSPRLESLYRFLK